jgi:hypothetical protein
MNTARRGKIASLPVRIREELNQRLLDGQQGPQILPWLTGLPEVLLILDRQWGEEPINVGNLSEWRTGGYQEWLAKREKVDRTKLLAKYCLEMSEAGGNAIGMSAAVAAGQLMDVLEDFDQEYIKALLIEKPETYIDLLGAVAKLQRSKVGERQADQRDRQLKQMDTKLEQSGRALVVIEERSRRQTAEAFLKWRDDQRALEIADSTAPQAVKMERLVELMFGAPPASSRLSSAAETEEPQP